MTETPAPTIRTGNIYDLGYRRYEGPRLGRSHAIRALVIDSFRTTYGIGRGPGEGRAGRVRCPGHPAGGHRRRRPDARREARRPRAVRGGLADRVRHLLPIDRRGDRPVLRRPGARAVLAGPATRGPRSVLRTGPPTDGLRPRPARRVRPRPDPAAAVPDGDPADRPGPALDGCGHRAGEDLPILPSVLAQALVITILFGSLSMLVAAFTPRRAYATAGIIALFIVPGLVASAVIARDRGRSGSASCSSAPARSSTARAASSSATTCPRTCSSSTCPSGRSWPVRS